MKAKQKIIIACVSFAMCSAIFLGVLVYPVFRGVLKDHESVLAHARELLQLKEDAKNSREFDILSTQYANEFSRLQELFVDSKTPIAFFRFLDETSSSLGIPIEKAPGLEQQREKDPWPSFEVRVAGRGLYPNVIAFLQKIENAPYVVEVQTLTLLGTKGLLAEENTGEVDFSFSLKVFTK